LAFAIGSAAAGAETTFQRMKDTVQHIMQEYKTDKLRYAVMVFGDQTLSPLSFGQTLPDEDAVGNPMSSRYIINRQDLSCSSSACKPTGFHLLAFNCF